MTGLEIILSAICMSLTDCSNEVAPTNATPTLTQTSSLSKKEMFQQWVDIFSGSHFRIGTVENFPLSYTERDENGSLVGKGVSFDFINILQKHLNFTYDIVLPPGNLEVSDENMKTTLIGMLINEEIDMAAAFLPVLSELSHTITYSTNLDEAEWLIMMKRPKESATGSGLLAPFHLVVWYLILIAVITFGPFIYLMTWLRYMMTKDGTNKPFKIGPCVWFVYGGLIKQGTTLSPEANSTRILFATWWIFITLLSAFYTANLTAFLTLSKFTLSINDPKDLLKKNNKWIAKMGGAFEYAVKNPYEELFALKTMVDKKVGMFESGTEDKVFLPYIEKDYVFIRDKPAIDLLMYEDYKQKTRDKIEANSRCKYVVTDKAFMTQPRAFGFPKSSNLTKIFNPILLSIVEAGIVKYKTNYELPGFQICPLNLKSTERRLKFKDLEMTYILAGVGIGIAFIAFCLEVCYRHRHLFMKPLPVNKFNIKNDLMNRPVGKWSPGPPSYQTIFGQPYGITDSSTTKNKIKNVNGRDYWIVELPSGDSRLIPVRTPSAFLFQYST